jgi:crotonobetainyl-CoA:carnitine CoA-transferase CaiB-like acyl-CoA transferase
VAEIGNTPTLGALAGVRIIDLSQIAAGPYGTSLLGDMGADVIKVEHPDGEPFRSIDNFFGPGESAYFYGVNRSKRSIGLDLAKAEGLEVLDRLVSGADVFVVAFRPSATKKLGLIYERLAAINPRLIYCSISAFGEDGPRADEPGMDILAQAISGMMALTGEPDRAPVKVGPPIADFVVSYLLGFAVCAALRARDRDGVGQKIELNLLDGMVASLANYATPYLASGNAIRRTGGGHPQLVPYQVFDAADGRMVVACLSDRFWQPLCEAVDRGDLVSDPRYATNPARVVHRKELVELFQRIFAQQTVTYWVSRLKERGVPSSVVNELEDALRDSQVRHNGMIVDLAGTRVGSYQAVNNPIRMSRTPPAVLQPGPTLGEHTEQILTEAGFDASGIQFLKERNIVK